VVGTLIEWALSWTSFTVCLACWPYRLWWMAAPGNLPGE